jgi:heat shock protein HslJ
MFVGCTSNPPGLESDADIEGTWILTEARRDGEIIAGYEGDAAPWVSFEGDQMEAFDGCNALSSAYQFDGRSIRFDQVFSTLSACFGGANAYLDAFDALSPGNVDVAVSTEGSTLTLSAGAYTLDFANEVGS